MFHHQVYSIPAMCPKNVLHKKLHSCIQEKYGQWAMKKVGQTGGHVVVKEFSNRSSAIKPSRQPASQLASQLKLCRA